ncbi:MAG: Ribonuclease P protein component, partial [uncultured Sphingomonas sp.]
ARPQGCRTGQARRLHRHQEDRRRRRPQPHEAPFPRACPRDRARRGLQRRRSCDDRPLERDRTRLRPAAVRSHRRARPAAPRM